jgi:hypothetical protein
MFRRLKLDNQVEQHNHAKQRPAWSAFPCIPTANLYQGDFLHGFTRQTAWLFPSGRYSSEHLHSQVLRVLFHLSDYTRRGELEQALHFAQRRDGTWREEAHRQVMAILVRLGERSAALHQYDRCRQVLEEEPVSNSSEETRSLHQRILAIGKRNCINSPSRDSFIGRRLKQPGQDLLADPDCRLLTILGLAVWRAGYSRSCRSECSRLPAWRCDDQLSGLNSKGGTDPASPTLLNSSSRSDPRAQLLEYLREQEVLLLLDTYEHLLAGEEHPANVGLLRSLLGGSGLKGVGHLPPALEPAAGVGISIIRPGFSLMNKPHTPKIMVQCAVRHSPADISTIQL